MTSEEQAAAAQALAEEMADAYFVAWSRPPYPNLFTVLLPYAARIVAAEERERLLAKASAEKE